MVGRSVVVVLVVVVAALCCARTTVTATATCATPVGCACGAVWLRCRGAGLRALPPLHAQLHDLDLSGNQISELSESELPPLPELQTLF